MVSPATFVTVVGALSGVATTLVNLAIAKKTEDRVEISEKELWMAGGAVLLGSSLAYLFVRSKEAP